MTQDEIIEMARQAGFVIHIHKPSLITVENEETWVCVNKELEAFAKLVEARTEERTAAKEREACEKACEDERNDPDDQFKNYEDTHDDGWIDGCNSCIAAIRARGEA